MPRLPPVTTAIRRSSASAMLPSPMRSLSPPAASSRPSYPQAGAVGGQDLDGAPSRIPEACHGGRENGTSWSPQTTNTRLKSNGVTFAGTVVGPAGGQLRQIFSAPELVDGQPFTVLELAERHRGYQGFLPPQADSLMKSTAPQ